MQLTRLNEELLENLKNMQMKITYLNNQNHNNNNSNNINRTRLNSKTREKNAF